jgi:hypothetical protein
VLREAGRRAAAEAMPAILAIVQAGGAAHVDERVLVSRGAR